MKTSKWVSLISFLAGSSVLCGQVNFSGTDAFSSIVTGNWSSDTTSTGGAFSVSGNVLNFTDAGLSTGQTSKADRTWILNAGSSIADWQVQIDLSLNNLQITGQVNYWNLSLQDSAHTTNYFLIEFVKAYQQANPFVRGNIYTNGAISTAQPSQQSDITGSTSVAVRASYSASTQTLTFSYDANGATGGYSFSNLFSANIGAGGEAWNMTTGDTFNLQLSASNFTSASATSALSSGVIFADNFVATSAIPEPGTYAAIIGVVALVVAARRRRSVENAPH